MIFADTVALSRLESNLRAYASVSKLTISEILGKKGNDLRIQLFRGFYEHKLGGKGAKKTNIAFAELKRRTRLGMGTLVRLKYLSDKWTTGLPDRTKDGKPLSRWQRLVYQETERRTAGIGILGVSFLSKRFRYTNRDGKFLASNNSKTLGTLVTITKTDESYTIEAKTPGMEEVSARYGIRENALNKVSEDMEVYLSRKFGEGFARSFR